MDFNLIFVIIILVFSAVIHEYSHGWMANYLGDPTAKYMGRLTLNPIPHIDPLGSIIVPLLLVLMSPFVLGSSVILAWAKPVPYNPYNLRDQKNGEMLVAAAGPASNLLIALIFSIFFRIMIEGVDISASTMPFFSSIIYIIYINLLLAVFNMIPIPPLDGSKILFNFLPYSAHNIRETLERNSLLFLLLFIFFGFGIVRVIINFLFFLATGQNL